MSIKAHRSSGFMLGFGIFPGIRTIDVYLPYFYLVIRLSTFKT